MAFRRFNMASNEHLTVQKPSSGKSLGRVVGKPLNWHSRASSPDDGMWEMTQKKWVLLQLVSGLPVLRTESEPLTCGFLFPQEMTLNI